MWATATKRYWKKDGFTLFMVAQFQFHQQAQILLTFTMTVATLWKFSLHNTLKQL
jgi:hypothetical protein